MTSMIESSKERKTSIGRYAAVAMGFVLVGSGLTRGDGEEDLASAKVRLELGVLATMSAATSGVGSLTIERAVGETLFVSVPVQLSASPGGGGCATNVGLNLSPIRQMPEGTAHAWEAMLTVKTATLERIELEVDWKRYARGAEGEPRTVAGDRRSVYLREGERHLLDFVSLHPAALQPCYSLALELKAGVAEDPALAERRVAYDLWLVDEGPGGSSTTRRSRMTAKHGEKRDFDFEPLRWSVPEGNGDVGPAGAKTHVSGHVRGRVTSDGSLELALLAARYDSPGNQHWAIGGAGEKRVRVGAGETIRLELPAPREAPRHPGESAAEIEADQRILAGLRERTVSLVLTARPVE